MFSEFEHYIFKTRNRERPFRDGNISVEYTETFGINILFDNGEKKIRIAHNARPCFRILSQCAVVFKLVRDSKKNAVHVAIFDENGDFTVHSGRITARDEVTYITIEGEIFKVKAWLSIPQLQAKINNHLQGQAIMLENHFATPLSSKSMLPYDFYSYEGKLCPEERNKHLGSIILFTMYLYLRNSPKDFSDEESKKEKRSDLLFENKALSYKRITELIDYLKNQNNYNDVLGELFENTVNLLKSSNISDEMLTNFFDKLFMLEHSYSDDDEKLMFALDPLGNYFERRYQAEKHHKVGKYFMALDKIADAVLLRNNALSILSNYNTFEKIAKKVVDE